MARHPNQQPMTVNTQRVNTGAPHRVEKPVPVLDIEDGADEFDQPLRAMGGSGLSLMMTGFSRGGVGFY